MGMQRYLLVLDIDRPVTDEQLDGGPVRYLAARQEREPTEVVVLSLARPPRLPTADLLLGGAVSNLAVAPVKFPFAPQPVHDVNAAAEHRMRWAVQRLTAVGCQASGIISDEDLLTAVCFEARSHDYDQLIVATSSQPGSWLARLLHRDPIHRLHWRWRRRLIVFPLSPRE
jgi:hypothetical protein